ncbi:MAG: hypothetical protein AB8H80_17600 [Planctomycetota bacterium]
MIFNTLTAAILAFAPCSLVHSAADTSIEAPSALAAVQDPIPPQAKKFETAFTRISTVENEEWFSKLITLNPNCAVVTAGHGIAVSQEGGLILPRGPAPADVTLTDPV